MWSLKIIFKRRTLPFREYTKTLIMSPFKSNSPKVMKAYRWVACDMNFKHKSFNAGLAPLVENEVGICYKSNKIGFVEFKTFRTLKRSIATKTEKRDLTYLWSLLKAHCYWKQLKQLVYFRLTLVYIFQWNNWYTKKH